MRAAYAMLCVLTLAAAALLLGSVTQSRAWLIQGHVAAPSCTTVSDVWSTTYFFDSYYSGGGTTVAVGPGLAANAPEEGIRCHTTGKWYWQYTDSKYGDGNFGIATAVQRNTVRVGEVNPTAPFCPGGSGTSCGVGLHADQILFAVNNKWELNSIISSTPASAGYHGSNNGQTIAFIVDLDNGFICVKNETTGDGWWGNASCDPANISSGGFPFTPFGQPMYLSFSEDNGTHTVTMFPGGGSPPSGYTKW